MATEKTTRAVQETGSGYTRMSLPADYIKEVTDHVKRTASEEELNEYLKELGSDKEVVTELSVQRVGGNKLILGPPLEQLQDSEPTRKFNLPNEISHLAKIEPTHSAKPTLERYISKVLQGIIISGSEQITVPNIGDWEDIRYDIIDAFDSQGGEGVEIHIDMDKLGESRITIGEEKDIENYIEEVQRFLRLKLLQPLSHIYETGDNRDRELFKNISDSVNRNGKDDQLDRWFTLTTRKSTAQIFDLNIDKYPTAFTELYIAKYLETVVDLTVRLIDALEYLEDKSKVPDEKVIRLEKFLYAVLTKGESTGDQLSLTESINGGEEPYNKHLIDDKKLPYDEQLAKAAKDSYTGSVGPESFRREFTVFVNRIELLDHIRYYSLLEDYDEDEPENDVREDESLGEIHEWHRVPEDFEELEFDTPAALRDFGVSVGEIGTLTERLIRYPRSITLVGIAANSVEEVHNIEPRSENENLNQAFH